MSELTVYAIDGLTPVVHPDAYVHPSAVLIGDVIIGARCYIGPCACLRGDFGRLILHDGANVQDTCVAGVPFKPELPAGVDLTVERKLGAKAEGRKFIALASGFNLGGYGDAKECQEAMLVLA